MTIFNNIQLVWTENCKKSKCTILSEILSNATCNARRGQPRLIKTVTRGSNKIAMFNMVFAGYFSKYSLQQVEWKCGKSRKSRAFPLSNMMYERYIPESECLRAVLHTPLVYIPLFFFFFFFFCRPKIKFRVLYIVGC